MSIGLMPQVVQLAPTTLALNVSYPDPLPDIDRVKLALREVNMLELVDEMQEGIDTVVDRG